GRPRSSPVRRSGSIIRSKIPTSSRSCCEKGDGVRAFVTGGTGRPSACQGRPTPVKGSSGSRGVELHDRARHGERRPEECDRGFPIIICHEEAVAAEEEQRREAEGPEGGEPDHSPREESPLFRLPNA